MNLFHRWLLSVSLQPADSLLLGLFTLKRLDSGVQLRQPFRTSSYMLADNLLRPWGSGLYKVRTQLPDFVPKLPDSVPELVLAIASNSFALVP